MDDPLDCHYCGATAETIDHVVPQSLLDAARDSGEEALIEAVHARYRKMTVPACRECNNLAGAVYDQTLADRRHRIAAKFERRHREALAWPDWADAELMSLSDGLRGYVLNGLWKRDEYRARLKRLKR